MNKRIITVVMTAAVVATTSGCAPFRNFFFGRGAGCGLCNRLSMPGKGGCRKNTPAPAPCYAPVNTAPPACGNTPAYTQPPYAPAPGNCGCNSAPYVHSSGYAPEYSGAVCEGCNSDPYSGTVIGNGVSGDGFYQAPLNEQGVRANYPPPYDTGYRLDRDGARIIAEDPIPPGATIIGE